MRFEDALARIRADARDTADLGRRFEQLVAFFLMNDRVYAGQFEWVKGWSEWSHGVGATGSSARDSGIDLVAQRASNGAGEASGLVAIQAKCYSESHTVGRQDIDRFVVRSNTAEFAERMFVTAATKWSSHARDVIARTEREGKPFIRIDQHLLADSKTQWSRHFDPNEADRPAMALKAHQKAAVDDVLKGFAKADRGKLVMACGTGKTYVALNVFERALSFGGVGLYLVPSLSLMGQSLREFAYGATKPFRWAMVCSDSSASRSGAGEYDIGVEELPMPPTTDAKRLAAFLQAASKDRITMVLSTYQSADIVAKAQKIAKRDFGLVICDEAHRTTGVEYEGKTEKRFTAVHHEGYIRAEKRLFMTATPRFYAPAAVKRGQEAGAEIYTMDDPSKYGSEFHKLSFGNAVDMGLLADYRVLVLAVTEEQVSAQLQQALAGSEGIPIADAGKIAGCWRGLAQHIIDENGQVNNADGAHAPMRQAVLFTNTIANSKAIAKVFPKIAEACRQATPEASNDLECEVMHIDGSMQAIERAQGMHWLGQAPKIEGGGG